MYIFAHKLGTLFEHIIYSLSKMVLNCGPNGRRGLGRAVKRLLDQDETGLASPKSWRVLMMLMMITIQGFILPGESLPELSLSVRDIYCKYVLRSSTQPLTERVPGIFLGGKGGRCVGLTTLPPLCADCLKIWEAQPPGNLRACQGL
jgi:hypothetical protein